MKVFIGKNLLREKFKAYNALLDNFTLSMQTFTMEKGENMESYFKRLMGYVNKLKG